MTWWQALILGIVEGLTEYLPVSSTGHLILTAWLLGFGDSVERWEASFTFNIVIQAGAIAAVFGLYWRRVKQMSCGLVGRDPAGLKLAINLIVAFLPAAVLGLLFHADIKAYLNGPWPVVGALFVGAWLMIAVAMNRKLLEHRHTAREVEDVTLPVALLIGFGQCIAMWPGTSRSMMTIVAAMLLGLRAKAAAEFSFLLGLITLGCATAYEGYQDGGVMLQHFGVLPVVIGFVASTICAALSVKWFVGFLTRHGLAPFGWYRLVIATLFAVMLWAGWVSLPTTEQGQTPAAPVSQPDAEADPAAGAVRWFGDGAEASPPHTPPTREPGIAPPRPAPPHERRPPPLNAAGAWTAAPRTATAPSRSAAQSPPGPPKAAARRSGV